MRLGAILSPTTDLEQIRAGATAADEIGLDAVGFWDHYHSLEPELAYLCGWSLYGTVAALTSRVKLVPMVLNNLHYEPGVLAKESSALALASGGRFELGIGAGDWPESFTAWGRPFPERGARLGRLEETVEALRLVWRGEPVDYAGQHVTLSGAICTPPPADPPRVVVGVAKSRRTLEVALRFADEVNVYADEEFVRHALESASQADRNVAVSLYLDWSWDAWPADPAGQLGRWREAGVERAFVCVAGDDMADRVRTLAAAV